MPKRLSFQLYCARKFPPLENTLALLAETGYREVEGYGGVYDDAKTLRKMLDANGLSMRSGHFGVATSTRPISQSNDRNRRPAGSPSAGAWRRSANGRVRRASPSAGTITTSSS